MTKFSRRQTGKLLGSAGLLGLFASTGASIAQSLTDVRFSVDWVWQSNHAAWTLAADKGIFADKGLNVAIDRGYGSADNMTKLAAGSIHIGMVDPNLIPAFNAANPDDKLISFFIVYDAAPQAVIFKKSSGIEAPKDIEGRKLAVTEGDATTILFPIFAKTNGIDLDKIEFLAVKPSLRDTMVIQDQADASLGFLQTAVLNIASAGVARDDIGYFPYSQYGLELYSSSLVCREDFAEKNPDVLRAFVEATIQGTRMMLSDPEGAIASVKKRDGLLKDDVELLRNELTAEISLLTPWVRENGMSTVDLDRFDRSMEQVQSAFGLEFKPELEDVFSDAFLPPQNERMIN